MVLKKLEIFNHQLQQYLTSSVTQLDKLFFKIGEVQDVDDHIFSNESLISYNTKIKFNIKTLTALGIKANEQKKKEEI